MPISGLILNPPNALVTLSSSPISVKVLNLADTNFVTGVIDDVYDTCDLAVVGDYVIFDKQKSPSFLYGSTVYYLVNVKDNRGWTEEPLP